MPDPNDPKNSDDQVSKRVVYEHVSTSGTARQNAIMIIVLLVIAIALVAFIFMRMR